MYRKSAFFKSKCWRESANQAVCRHRAVKALHRTGCATENEMLQTKLFTNYCLSKAAAMGPYAHPTNERLSDRIDAINGEMVSMKGEMASMKSEIASMSRNMTLIIKQMASMSENIRALINQTNHTNKIVDQRFGAIEARQKNAAAVDGADSLCPIPNGGKPVPAVFPWSRDRLRAMTVSNLDSLLAYYELDVVGNAAEKRRRLSLHLGLVLRQVENV